MKTRKVKTLIIGAGVTGLGCAWRLNELTQQNLISSRTNWLMVDRADKAGGAAASYTDRHGFTWDNGSHVIYSRYAYFDNILKKIIGNNVKYNDRCGWVWLKNVFIPYPLQQNLQRLPHSFLLDCLQDLLSIKNNPSIAKNNFKDFVTHKFGHQLATNFFIPHAYKMFGHPTEQLSTDWIGYKSGSKHCNVPDIDILKIIENILHKTDTPGWEQADAFPYPVKGGTGIIWQTMFDKIPSGNIKMNESLTSIDPDKKIARFESGLCVHYENLISTMPLPYLLKLCDFQGSTDELKYSSAHFIGLGFKGKTPKEFIDKMWIYNPNLEDPYFRLSIPSNYSQDNVPVNGDHWSLLCEVSVSPYKTVDEENIVNEIEHSINQSFALGDSQKVSTWHKKIKYAYALPSLERDHKLKEYEAWLKQRNIFSRGRFGNWKYECGNQDSSFMQGVEVIDNILFGTEELTHPKPELIGKNMDNRAIVA